MTPSEWLKSRKPHRYRRYIDTYRVSESTLIGLEVRCSVLLSYGRVGTLVRVPGAGEGNRTPIASLEGWSSTIELHPHAGLMVVGARGFEPPTPCSQSRCATGLRHAPYTRPSVSIPEDGNSLENGGGGGSLYLLLEETAPQRCELLRICAAHVGRPTFIFGVLGAPEVTSPREDAAHL